LVDSSKLDDGQAGLIRRERELKGLKSELTAHSEGIETSEILLEEQENALKKPNLNGNDFNRKIEESVPSMPAPAPTSVR